jgi:two-component system response regulator PilR (NtrC family)
VREVVRSILTQEKYSVVTARDGLEAIKILRIEDVHLVITDLRMPGADGLEVLKFTVRNNPDTAVVILTAFGTLDTALESLKEGAYDYLTKPFKVLEIITLTDKAYKRSLMMKDNRELKKHLRDTYHDIELIKTVASCNNGDITKGWIERVERLKSMSVFSSQEAALIQERLATQDGNREDTHSR